MTENPLTVQPQPNYLSPAKEVKRQVVEMHELFRDVMQVDTHYGVIEGTKKPTLYKAGAEKIALLLHLAPFFERTMTQDGDHLTVLSECVLTHSPSGTVVARAGAICTTKETKYAFRQATRKCPECGKLAIMKSKQEYGGGWYCFTKKDGCNAKFKDDDPRIAMQSGDREDNPNLADAYNTVLKMSDKRAFVAAILFGTAASDIYTQDVEDFGDLGGTPTTSKKKTVGLSDEEMAEIESIMESHAEDGTLHPLWTVDSRGWAAKATESQMKRLISFKDELKADRAEQAAGGGETAGTDASTSPAPEPAASPEPKKTGNGRRKTVREPLAVHIDTGKEDKQDTLQPPGLPDRHDDYMVRGGGYTGAFVAMHKTLAGLNEDNPKLAADRWASNGAEWSEFAQDAQELKALGQLKAYFFAQAAEAGFPQE